MYRRQTNILPIAALAAPILGSLGGDVIKKLFHGRSKKIRRRYAWRRNISKAKSDTAGRYYT